MSQTVPIAFVATGAPGWWRRHRLQLAALAVAALGLGSMVGLQAADIASREQTIDGLRGRLEDTGTALATTQSELSRAQSALVDVRAQLASARQDAQKAGPDAQAKANAEYRTRADAVHAREEAVTRRERRVAATEAGLNAIAFTGDGTYLVNRDIQPGLYRAAATQGCTWTRLRDLDSNADSVIASGGSDGQVTLKVSSTDAAVDLDGCGPFKKIG